MAQPIINELKDRFKDGDIVLKFIYFNVAVFLITALTGVIGKLFALPFDTSFNFLALPASVSRFLAQPWSIVTYMFLHAGIWHILFNMLCLYWFGEIFLMYFSSKHLRGLFFLGGFFGGLFFILAYQLFPYFIPQAQGSLVVGASASILAIIVAVAYREPNYRVALFLVGRVSLKYLAAIAVIIDLLFVTSDNAGGHIAHLGGALGGLLFAWALTKGVDLTSWINKTIDFFFSLFRYHTWHRKPKMKVHFNPAAHESDQDYNQRKKKQSEEIDRILDKLKKSGYESLTDSEKKSLFDASRR